MSRPVFIRQFASAEDLKREHPILNRSLDIIAGPKDPELQSYALQDPSVVTTDSRHRIFVTDVRAEAVHVFDFANSTYSRLYIRPFSAPLIAKSNDEKQQFSQNLQPTLTASSRPRASNPCLAISFRLPRNASKVDIRGKREVSRRSMNVLLENGRPVFRRNGNEVNAATSPDVGE
jgi:hypothetical protein